MTAFLERGHGGARMIIKCKMCGGDIQFNPGDTCGQCDHCGCTTTFPKLPDEQRANLFNRANHFRRQCEFDKAMAAYEHILEVDDTDAEAHWGIVLSKFGIEYVEDPVTHERIPTCHRAQVISILSDEDYQNAIKYAPDTQAREIYETEAKRIAEIQKGILAISSQEKPYDVFICYKETDDSGSRTKDSTLAQEIYYQLTNEGYKVFFSRITLEDKLGQEYEPYIFAALNSAKVMLVVGTKPENFSAIWVKNEWSRFLAIMKNDRKRVLIPCYRDMDPYDLPEELSSLQSQDMSKIGFMQDLIHGVKKVLGSDKQSVPNVTVQSAGPGVASLHKRAVLFLEDSDWDSASEYFDRILDIDPEYAPAYIGKVQVKNKVRREVDLARCREPISTDTDYQKALRFADEKQKAIYEGYNRAILDRIDLERKEAAYREAAALESRAAVEADFLAAAKKFDGAEDIRDAKERAANCRAKAATAKAEAEKAAAVYKAQMERERKEREKQEEERRLAEEKRRTEEAERQRKEEALRQEKRKRTIKISSVIAAIVILIAGGYFVYGNVIQPKIKYDQAQALLNEGKLDEAYAAFSAMRDYGDSATKLLEINYKKAEAFLEEGKLDEAYAVFNTIRDYGDSTTKLLEINYEKAEAFLKEGKLDEAKQYYELAAGYSDANQKIKNIDAYIAADTDYQRNDLVSAAKRYQELGEFLDASSKLEAVSGPLYDQAKKALEEKDYEQAYDILCTLGDYSDCSSIAEKIDNQYSSAIKLFEEKRFDEAITAFQNLYNFKDSKRKVKEAGYQKAEALLKDGKYEEAISSYAALGKYMDSQKKIYSCEYKIADQLYSKKEIDAAIAAFERIIPYSDSQERANSIRFEKANALWQSGELQSAAEEFKALGEYKTAATDLIKVSTELADRAMADKDYAAALAAYQVMEQTDEIKKREYELAQACYDEGLFEVATKAYESLGQYELSLSKLPIARYAWADQLFNTGEYAKAAEQFAMLGNMSDSAERANESTYQYANQLLEAKEFNKARAVFGTISQYKDGAALVNECDYRKAKVLFEAKDYSGAEAIYKGLGSYGDSATRMKECIYNRAATLFNEGKYDDARVLYSQAEYSDSSEKAKECAYLIAKEKMESKQYAEAEKMLRNCDDYKDSADQIKECRYQQGIILQGEKKYQEALTFFDDSSYKDSKQLAEQCHYELGEIAQMAGDIENAIAQYAYAVDNESAKDGLFAVAKDYAAINETEKAIQVLWLIRIDNDAKNLLKELGSIKEQSGQVDLSLLAYLSAEDDLKTNELIAKTTYDSFAKLITKCTLLPEEKQFMLFTLYRYANALRDNNQYEDAITVYEALNGYSDSATQVTETKYLKAKYLTTKGDYAGAVTILKGIRDYKDAGSLLKNDINLSAARDAEYSVGSYVTFGHYPQTSEGNDNTKIEWLVLARDGNKALLVSRYGLAAKPYNTEYTSITWEECTLRTWLNDVFLMKAFTTEEQTGILLTNVDNSSSQGCSEWSRNGGNNTQDKVFLLSYAEANKYLGVTYDDIDNTKSRVAPTAYAIKQGAWTSSVDKTGDGMAAGWWWLRSPGNNQYYAAFVGTAGSLSGGTVSGDLAVVRPALWINLESDIF